MIQQAYDLTNIVFTTAGQTVSANGAGETIAIVDAFGDPDISSDLQTFDANFGISNDDAKGNFVLTVATPLGSVRTNSGWALEESLDVEWAHAIAPEADILLVEAPSASVTALTGAAVWAASQSGVVAVSMSWGDSPEFAGESADDKDFTTPASHPGVTFVAASGDDAEPNYPSTSPNVLAVGGTTLTVDGSGNWISESPWSESGGGNSPYENTTKPDVAYDGDPSTGFLVYDSIPQSGESGWQVVGGTSAGTPQWAAIIALVDQGRSLLNLGSLDGPTQTISDIYALPSTDFNKITGSGFTGLGSPIGAKIISALVGGNITSVNVPASKLAFAQQPTSATAGSPFAPAVVVDLEDQNGDIATGNTSSVVLTIATGPSGATLGGTFTVAAVNGVATFNNLILTKAGNYTLKATDGSFTATTVSFTVSPAAASQLVINRQPTNATTGIAISPAVTVDVEDQFGNLVTTDTSNITLAVNTGPGLLSGTTTVTAVGGQATFGNLSLQTPGTYTLKATDGSLVLAVSNSFTINPASSNTALATSSNQIFAGQVVALIATVTSGSGSPTGTVTFMDGSTLIGSVTINPATHQAIGYTASLPVGSNNITAIYNGATGFATSSTSLTETVKPLVVTTTALAASSNPISAGQVVALIATVTSGSGSPTGTVTFMDGSTLIGTVILDPTTHQAIGYTASLPLGSNNITATYNGATGFATSSKSLTETVKPIAATTTALAASSNPISAGQVVALIATVTSGSGSPTGTVTFMDGSTLIGTVILDPTTNQAIGYTASLPEGFNDIMAIYNGTPGFTASSASLIEIVN